MVVYMPSRLRPRQQQSAHTRLHDSLASRDFAYLLPILTLCQRLDWFMWATVVGTYVFAIAWVVMAQRERRHQQPCLLTNKPPRKVRTNGNAQVDQHGRYTS
jgi:hypothetical protein